MVPTVNSDPSDESAGGPDTRLCEQTTAVLDRLRDRSAPVTLSELAAAVADLEPSTGNRYDEATDSHLHQVQARLHHVDLPVLHEAGFLDYDEANHLVSPRVKSGQERPTLDMAFKLLAESHRRAALECLIGHPPIGVHELAARVAEEEHAAAPGEPPTDAIDRVRQALYHRHLPKLQQANVIDFDRERGLVLATENAYWLHSVWRGADRSSERFNRRS